MYQAGAGGPMADSMAQWTLPYRCPSPMVSASFPAFRALIRATDPDAVAMPDAIPAGFLVARDKSVSAHYTPFDYVNRDARVVVVGITPGFAQWKNAVREARRQ